MTKDSRVKVEESLSTSEQGYTMGKLLDGVRMSSIIGHGS